MREWKKSMFVNSGFSTGKPNREFLRHWLSSLKCRCAEVSTVPSSPTQNVLESMPMYVHTYNKGGKWEPSATDREELM